MKTSLKDIHFNYGSCPCSPIRRNKFFFILLQDLTCEGEEQDED